MVERRDPLLGAVFDRRFRIEGKIAAGGFGAIYRATHLKSGHEFALKLLHPNLTGDRRVVARFRREGAALTRLRDPHTVTAYELGEAPDGTLYIVMELLRGESLYERHRMRGALPWRRVITMARDVCSSLAEAHALGIVHRDLKPTNIHLEPRDNGEDFVKVLDFGIAKILQGSDIDSAELTSAGQMIGTLDYMSPEQMVGGMCAPSSDIYTLGIVMYEMIAGRKPYEDASSAASALAAMLTSTPERLSTQLVLPADVDRVVMRCLERQHGDRFQTAADLAVAIDEILSAGDEAITSVASPIHKPASSNLRSMPSLSKPAPVAQRRGPVAAGSAPVDSALTPPEPATGPVEFDSTLIGHHPVTHLPATPERSNGVPMVPKPLGVAPLGTMPPGTRGTTPLGTLSLDITALEPTTPVIKTIGTATLATTAPAGTMPPLHGTPLGGSSRIPTTNLRAAYPKIVFQPPSAMRPHASAFDDRPASSIDVRAPYGIGRRARREAVFRGVALAVGLVLSFIVGILLASQL